MSGLRIISLGGSGTVTQNMYVYEYEHELLLIDCGIGFPQEKELGVLSKALLPGQVLFSKLPVFQKIKDEIVWATIESEINPLKEKISDILNAA